MSAAAFELWVVILAGVILAALLAVFFVDVLGFAI